MTALEKLKQTEWYQSRPEVIRQAIDLLPPIQIYQFRDSKKHCIIVSYEEPESGRVEDVTVTVQKTGVGGVLTGLGLGALDTNSVFGVALNDLEPVKEEEQDGSTD